MEHWKNLTDRENLSETELKQIPSDNMANFQSVLRIYEEKGWDTKLLLKDSGVTLCDFKDSAKWIDPRTSETISRNFFRYANEQLSHKYGYTIGYEHLNVKSIVNTFLKYTPFRTIIKNTYATARKLENSFDYKIDSPTPKNYRFKVIPKNFKKMALVGHESYVFKGFLHAVYKIKNIKIDSYKTICRSSDIVSIINFFYKDHGFEINEDEIYRNGELFARKISPIKVPELLEVDSWEGVDEVFIVVRDYNYLGETIFREGDVYNSPFCCFTWSVDKKTLFMQKLKDLSLLIKKRSLGDLEEQLYQNNKKAKELLQLSAVLKEKERSKALFLANIVHEIKSPLASIVMLIDSLMDHVSCAPDFVQEGFQLLDDKGTRLTNFVDNVMSYFSLDNGSFSLSLESIDLAFLMNDVLDNFTNIPDRKELFINSLLVPDRFIVNADYYRIVQVFLNLINNSVKFTKRGFVRINADFEEEYVVVSIEDSGEGIEVHKLESIFNQFETNLNSPEKNNQGLGLGLYIAKSIIDLHNGKIEVYSKVGQGTTFRVYLPYMGA